MNPPILLIGFIVIPVLAALFIMAGFQIRRVAIFAASLNFLGSLVLLGSYNLKAAGYQMLLSVPVYRPLGLHFTLGVDGLSVAMVVLTTVVTLAAVCVARPPEKNPELYFACLLVISSGALGAFLSIDTLFFYMFHELALIPTFLLIGIWGTGDRQAAAWKVTIYLALGSFILLVGIIGLYLSLPVGLRTFDMRNISDLASLGAIHAGDTVFLLLFFGFGILISLFPFHTWAPQAYASAPPPAAMLHAGVMKKFGLYGLLRLVTPIFPEYLVDRWNTLLLVLLLANVIYVGLVTMAQRKLDWMVGYSSVMHMGYAFLGILAWNLIGLTGAAFFMVAHGLAVAALFALSGELRERTGTLEFSDLGGLGKAMPVMGILFGFAAMASLGLPGFANFAAELMVFFGAFSRGGMISGGWNAFEISTAIALWGVVISAVYTLRAYRKIFFGALPDRWKGLSDIALLPRICVTGLIVLLLLAGFFPQVLVNYLQTAFFLP